MVRIYSFKLFGSYRLPNENYRLRLAIVNCQLID